jgi:hypothetical protein
MTKNRILLLFFGILSSLFTIVGLIIYLVRSRVITPELGLLLLTGLLGLYIGCGVLIVVYRLLRNLA